MRSQRMTTGEPVTTDYVRHAVKEYFRPRLMERLLDPKRTDAESWRQLRELIDELPSSDRGNLAEEWYRGRYLPDAQARVGVGVERMTGESAGQIESRVIDAVDGGTAVEIKDISGQLDEDQLGAYPVKAGSIGPTKTVAYVFMDEAQARAHLHELWLRELECWLVDDQGRRRLDLDYRPVPDPPAWVRRLGETL